MTTSSDPAPGLTSAQKRTLLAQLLLRQAANGQAPACWDLSYGQQAMWFIYQLAPQNPAYNVAFSARILSEPDIDAMRRAFQALLDRHPMLRTTFGSGDQHPVQYVRAQAEITFEQIDAAGWSESEMQQRVEAYHRRPFDLEHGPVFRVTLFTQAPAEHVLLLSAHHIVMDGWTLGILLDEFRVVYAAECDGQPAALPAVGAEYVDFVRWQADMLSGPPGDRLRAYWQRQLGPPLPTIALPTDRPRPPRQTFKGGTHAFELDEDLTGRIKDLARTERTTTYTVMLAAFVALLNRWSGQDDLVLGSPTSGRDRAAFAGVVGDFVDMQVLRIDCSGDATLRELLGRTRQTVLAALEHQGYPFTAVIEQLHLARDASRSPVYQIGFDLQRLARGGDLTDLIVAASSNRVTLGGLVMQAFQIPQQEGQLDLMLQCVEVGGRLIGGFKYSTDLFDAVTIKRLAADFRVFVAAMTSDADRIVKQLPLSPPREHDLAVFLAGLRRLDVKLWMDGERLRVNAPAGTLTPELQTEIGRRKLEIVDRLKLAQGAAIDSSSTAIVPVARTGRLPLSFGQQRLWFMDQFDPGNSAYNIPIPLRLRGPLRLTALRLSLNEVLRRHEALRTRFVLLDGEPAQVIEPAAPIELEMRDFRHLPVAERLDTALRFAHDAWSRPFDLQRAPVLRALLLQLDHDDHVLVIVLHHIAGDAWSMGVLGRELSALYEAFGHGRPSPLPALPIQYADFAVSQRNWLQGERLQTQLAYWSDKLRGTLPVLELPTDHPRPATLTSRGARQHFMLDTGLVDELTAFSRGETATLFMSLLAAFKTLIYRLTRQEDILVGTPVAGRNQEETQALIGLFINNLVLRTDLSGDPTFRELLARVRTVNLEAFAHQDVPFDKLVETIQPDRDTSWPPLFQVLFSLQNVPVRDLELDGLGVKLIDPAVDTSRFDLIFELYYRPAGLQMSVEYRTDLFEADTIRRFAAHYEMLLRGILDNPDARISELPLLAEAERQQLVGDWNATDVEYPTEAGVHHLIEEQAAREPNAVAVVFEDRSLTYAELNRRGNQVARHLQDLGVGSETIVGVYLERSLDMVVALLGILKAGGTYLPLDPLFPAERLAYMLEDSRAAVVVTQHSLVGTIATGQATVVRLDADWPLIAARADENLAWQTTAERLAYILYTSGSTGRPKGVQVLHSSLVNFLESMRERPGLASDDVLLSVTTLSFDIAGLELFLPLTTGARVVLVSSAVAADGGALLEALQRSGATVMQATPATWRLLLAAGWERMPRLRALCGGEAVSAELAAQIVARTGAMWNMYGPTETTIWSTVHPISASATGASVPIGRPIANTSVYVLDGRLEPVPVGVPGELYIGGAGVARGYLNLPELTAERFVADPFRPETGGRMYRTGDLVRWRADGNLDYLERVDTQVKIRGYRIELGEIETLLEQDASVRQAVVIVREDVPDDKRLVGYVVPTAAAGVSVQALKDQLRKTLPAYMVPTLLVTLDQLPLTPNGKVDRKALAGSDAVAAPATEGYAGPRDSIERTLVALWEELLGHGSIGIHDNFFDVGGHSLLAARLVFQISARLGRNLPVATLISAATVAELATLIRAPERDEIWDPLVVLQTGAPGNRPLFFVHGAFGDVLCYTELARALGPQQPCYVLQAIGLDGVRAPQERVEDMATTYIQEMRSIQPVGPYCLAGYSIGGTIVFEMARQLKQAGEEIALLTVFDHPPALGASARRPSLATFSIRFARNVLTNIPHWVQMARQVERGSWTMMLRERLRLGRRALARLARRADSVEDAVREVEEANGLSHLVDWPEYRRRVLEYQFRAMRTYELKPYEGRLLLFRAQRQPLVSAHDPHLGWGELIRGGIDVIHVQGNHKDLLHQPHVQTIAAGLRPQLDALPAVC
jgi:amino acid adenylation domain-containing protein